MKRLIVDFEGNGIIKIQSKTYVFDCFCVPKNKISNTISGLNTKMFVYVLVNKKEATNIKRQIYIGKTTQGMVRFFSHRKNKKWFDQIFIFTADEGRFDNNTISGLENALIKKYKDCQLYNIDQENSTMNISDDCEEISEQIISILDFLGYPVEVENEQENKDELENVEITNDSNLCVRIKNKILKLNKDITIETMKLYEAYKLNKKNICAISEYNYGLEVQLYIKLSDINDVNSGAYDISYRRRGKKESAIKVTNENELEKALSIIKQIIDNIVG